jgi:metallo-beta-lactamase family protein
MADYVFLESTYGNKLHPDTDTKLELETAINSTFQRGTVIIPSFAVERARIMYLLWQLRLENRITDIQYIIDLPMELVLLTSFFKTIGIKFQFLIV